MDSSARAAEVQARLDEVVDAAVTFVHHQRTPSQYDKLIATALSKLGWSADAIVQHLFNPELDDLEYSDEAMRDLALQALGRMPLAQPGYDSFRPASPSPMRQPDLDDYAAEGVAADGGDAGTLRETPDVEMRDSVDPRMLQPALLPSRNSGGSLGDAAARAEILKIVEGSPARVRACVRRAVNCTVDRGRELTEALGVAHVIRSELQRSDFTDTHAAALVTEYDRMGINLYHRGNGSIAHKELLAHQIQLACLSQEVAERSVVFLLETYLKSP